MGRMLDLVATNIECKVSQDLLPLVREDSYHPALSILCNINSRGDPQFDVNVINLAYNFKRANFVGLYNALTYIDWSFLDVVSDVNRMCDLYYKKLYSVLDLYVPKYKTYSRKYPLWYNSDIIRNIKVKDKIHRKYLRDKRLEDYNEFSRLRRIIKQQISLAYNSYLQKIESDMIANPKQFWSFIHSKQNSTRIPGRMTLGGSVFDKPGSIVNAFADFFQNVYLSDSIGATPQNGINIDTFKIDTLPEQTILNALLALPNKFTAGEDKICSFFIRDAAHILVLPLQKIFNVSLQTCVFPTKWKIARICPIFKEGNKCEIANYRGIAILNNFAKVFEMSLYALIYPRTCQLISTTQHGFMRNRSTVTNLVELTQDVSEVLDNRGQVDVAYTDFSKAFDRISHSGIIGKLPCFGFSDQLVKLLSSYLSDRMQYVFYNGYSSHQYRATSGVPQGSNLGPLSFLYFINDLSDHLTCSKLLFADDLKIYTEVNSTNDCLTLQNDLDILYEWCDVNKLHLNVNKCKICTFTKKLHPVHFNYQLDNINLARLFSVKDLGVTFDAKLEFVPHIENIVSSATKSLGFLIRNCKAFSNICTLKILYFTLVRSKLEYASIVWNPCYANHTLALESVQRKFLKYLSFKVDGTYPRRGANHSNLLAKFDVQPLELRRDNYGLKFLYKLVHSEIDSGYLLSKLNFYVPKPSSRRCCTFYQSMPRTNLLAKAPLHVMCSNFNSVSEHCDINYSDIKEIVQKYSEIYYVTSGFLL
nr:unnamed protein product [Callosobruchus analis]